MSAAGFILAINVFVSGLFIAAFSVIALRSRLAVGARWLALAYSMGVVNAALEFAMPTQQDPRLLGILIYVVSLSGFLICVIGLARHYTVRVPWIALAVLAAVSIVANAILIDQPSSASLMRGMIYQLPYFGAHLLGAMVVLNSRRRQALDVTLVIFLLLSSLQFVAKPFMSLELGSPAIADYLHSVYAAYSQMMVAFLLITNGVLMLLILVRDEMAALTLRSDTDKLSGLWNRRGFEDRTEAAMLLARRAQVPSALVIADLDNFKTINDTLGHERGDRVIEAFARLMAEHASGRMVVGRQGGEEFVVYLPGSNLASALLYAEAVRRSFPEKARSLGLQTCSASFGVVELQAGEDLSGLLRRADVALYHAKKNGRNRVSATDSTEPVTPTFQGDRRRGSRRPD